MQLVTEVRPVAHSAIEVGVMTFLLYWCFKSSPWPVFHYCRMTNAWPESHHSCSKHACKRVSSLIGDCCQLEKSRKALQMFPCFSLPFWLHVSGPWWRWVFIFVKICDFINSRFLKYIFLYGVSVVYNMYSESQQWFSENLSFEKWRMKEADTACIHAMKKM